MRASLAGVAAVAVTGVMVAAPLSVPQANAEVVPLARGEVMNQELMAAATESAEFTIPTVEVAAAPEPEPEDKPATRAAAGEKGAPAAAAAPAAGVPDPGSAKAIAQGYVGSGAEFDCLVALWDRESGWNINAHNASSGAHGIPQALPGSKMASAGADWQTNPDTQIRWGLGYIKGRYGSPCAAWGHSEAVGWY